jgi:biopolymer transport protein ExbB
MNLLTRSALQMLAELLSRGGPVMYVLLACSLISLAIILERSWFWFTETMRSTKRERACILQATADEELALSGSPFVKKLAQVRKLGKEQQLASLLRKESERAYERAIKFLSGLDTIVSITPLLGILGTVLGIMKSFHALDLQHMTAPGEVGHGLAEAMITTATGLAIAVPTLAFFNLFHSLAARHAAALYKLSEDVSESVAFDSSEQN